MSEDKEEDEQDREDIGSNLVLNLHLHYLLKEVFKSDVKQFCTAIQQFGSVNGLSSASPWSYPGSFYHCQMFRDLYKVTHPTQSGDKVNNLVVVDSWLLSHSFNIQCHRACDEHPELWIT